MVIKRKYFFVLLLGFLLYSYILNAQSSNSNSQVLVPMEIYVGDTAELQITFQSAQSLFDSKESLNKEEIKLLNIKGSPLCSIDSICSVTSGKLLRKGDKYTIILSIIPWNSGRIQLPSFNVKELLKQKSKDGDKKKLAEKTESGLFIKPHPFNVVSLVQKRNITKLQPSLSPLLIPGTTYIIYFVLLFFLFFLIVIIYILSHLQKMISFYKRIITFFELSRNDRIAFKKLKTIQRNSDSYTTADLCSELQNTIRIYLKGRFYDDYTMFTTSEIEQKLNDCVDDDILDNLLQILRRTDYLRYAAGSLDSKRQPASLYAVQFQNGEISSLLENLKKDIIYFSKRSNNMEI